MRKPTSFELGVGLTFLWILFGILLACTTYVTRPVTLDGWGNVLAGFFSPVAFLWLVLGYRQQGEELQQNTEALRLQAQELKLAVEQYQDMAKTQREQLEHERQVAAKDEEERTKLRRPKFELTLKNSFNHGNEGRLLNCELTNHGGEVTDIELFPQMMEVMVVSTRLPRLNKGETSVVTFRLEFKHPFTVRISYQKVDGAGEEIIQVLWSESGFYTELIQAAT